MHKKHKEPNLLGAGWQPLNRDFDWNYFWQIWDNNPWELTQKALNLASYIADVTGNTSRLRVKG